MKEEVSRGDKTNLLRDVVTDVYLLIVQKHAVDGFDGGVGSLSCFVMDETVTLGTPLIVGGDLTG